MDNYESRPLLPMPLPKPLKEMTDEKLTKLLTGKFNYCHSRYSDEQKRNELEKTLNV